MSMQNPAWNNWEPDYIHQGFVKSQLCCQMRVNLSLADNTKEDKLWCRVVVDGRKHFHLELGELCATTGQSARSELATLVMPQD